MSTVVLGAVLFQKGVKMSGSKVYSRKNGTRVYVHSQMACFRDSCSMGRPTSYKSWTDSRMTKAMEAVSNGSSVRKAAVDYCAPRSTLHDRIYGKVIHGTKSGPRKYLTSLEEEQLVSHLRNCSSIGYGKSRKDTLALVQAAVNKKGFNTQVSPSWLKSFAARHPELTLKTGESISKARQTGASKENLESYFDLLEQTLHDNDLLHRPCQIFNTDETGVPLDPKPLKVYGTVSQKNFYSVSTGNKSQITVLACVSAGGLCLSSMIIYNRKGLGDGMDDGTIPGTLFAFSPKGWMDTELFENWFFHHFLVYAPPVRPLLHLLDGHSSHYSPTFVSKAAEEKIIVFCLPPNTTHRTQPLDKGAFSPLKLCWREDCHNFFSNNPGKVINHYNFGYIFSRAWRKAMTPSNIMAGFKITGVYPVNRYAILPREKDQVSLCERTGLKFIPFYTPTRSRRILLPSHVNYDDSLVESSLSEDNDNKFSSLLEPNDDSHPFTAEEEVKFRKRLEEGYDIATDSRYNLWLKSLPCDVLPPQTTIAPFLTVPEVKYPSTMHKASGRIITGMEYRKALMEKEEKKKVEAERKALRREERERKKL